MINKSKIFLWALCIFALQTQSTLLAYDTFDAYWKNTNEKITLPVGPDYTIGVVKQKFAKQKGYPPTFFMKAKINGETAGDGAQPKKGDRVVIWPGL